MDWEAGKREGRRQKSGAREPAVRLNESSREGTNPGPLRKGPCTTLARLPLSLSRGCLIRQSGIEGPQSVLQRSVWIGASFEKVERRH